MATRSLGQLTIDLVARIGGLTRGMDQADRELAKRRQKWERDAKAIGNAIATVGIAASAALAAMIRNASRAFDETTKLAQSVGVTTQELSGLTHAAELSGLSQQQFSTSLVRLTKNMSDATQGIGEGKKGFDALGISVKNADGELKSSTAILREVADELSKYRDGAEKTAIAVALFGRTGADLIPLLNQGAAGISALEEEAEQLGLTFDERTGKAAEEFNDNLSRLKGVATGFARTLAAELLPDLQQLTGDMVKSAKESRGFSDEAKQLANTLRDVGSAASWAGERIRESTGWLEKMGFVEGVTLDSLQARRDQLLKINRNRRILFGNIFDSDDIYRELAKLDKEIDRLTSPFANVRGRSRTAQGLDAEQRPTAPQIEGTAKAGKSEAQKQAEALERAYENLNKSLDQQIELFGQAGQAARVRYEIERGALQGIDELRAQQLIKDAEHLDLLDEIAEHEKIIAETAKRVTDEKVKQQERQERVLEQVLLEIDALRLTNEQLAIRNALLDAGVEAESEFGKKIVESVQELYKQGAAVDDQIAAMDGLRDAARGFLDDLKEGEGFFDAMKNAADRLLDTIFDIVAQNIVESLFGQQGSTGAGTGGGNWISSIFGAFFGGGRANGGRAMPNRLYEVNERGFEMASVGGRDYMLTGNKSVDITPNDRIGGGVTVEQNFYNPQMNDPRSESQRLQQSAFRLRVATARNG